MPVSTGVARTALLVAAARAMETHRPDSLAQDPYAEHFVRAVPECADWPLRPTGGPLWGRLGRYFGLRTRVFDDVLTASARAGAYQVVLLGAGLDTRAHRLTWPAATVVHEVDQPHVLDFKHQVLHDLDAHPTVRRHPVPADLRDPDWPAGLLAAGFDRDAPSTWLAEGLFLYLPSDAEARVVATVDALSAPGSTFTYEVKLGVESPAVRDNPVYTAARTEIGVDLLRLFDPEPRPDSAADLAGRGWQTTTHTPFEFTALHGRGPRPEPDDTLAANRWVFARKR